MSIGRSGAEIAIAPSVDLVRIARDAEYGAAATIVIENT